MISKALKKTRLSLTNQTQKNYTHQWHIIHVINHHALMLRAILAPPAHMGLDHITSIQKGHLAVGLDPHLVARVRGDHVQRRYVKTEFARLRELAQTCAEREEVRPRDRGGKVGERKRHVVDARSVQAKDMSGGRGRGIVGGGGGWGRSDEVGQGAAGVVGELGEESLRLGLGERSHF